MTTPNIPVNRAASNRRRLGTLPRAFGHLGAGHEVTGAADTVDFSIFAGAGSGGVRLLSSLERSVFYGDQASLASF